jgi:hypothetical protein
MGNYSKGRDLKQSGEVKKLLLKTTGVTWLLGETAEIHDQGFRINHLNN